MARHSIVTGDPLVAPRRLAYAALVLAFAQIVFGAIVRITGSGMGCGDHWPKCLGAWFPPHDRTDLVIEITHRYIALALSFVVVALALIVLKRRKEPVIGGPGGMVFPSLLASVLVVTAALLGAVTVKLGLNPFVIAAHLTIAMGLLATLAVVLFRANAEPAEGYATPSTQRRRGAETHREADGRAANRKTYRAARVAVALAIVTLVMGALTANLPGAASSCGGFPWCRTVNSGGTGLTVQIVHRVIAFLLFAHLGGIAYAVRKRGEARNVVRAANFAFFTALAQLLTAAAMVEMQFPPILRSLHQATGTLLWLAVVILALVSAREWQTDIVTREERAAA
ncbi:MAG TPA: COX15/CtaA family protein [Gemmatimonadaceae bacterium]|nr:COX15/CtaA family protein [Gemmatimonadaceae bacterium]